MTLIYEWDKYRYTLEELVNYNDETQILWNNIILNEFFFWIKNGVITLNEIIVEASDAFEEELHLLGYNIEFTEPNDEKFDYNLLLDALRR